MYHTNLNIIFKFELVMSILKRINYLISQNKTIQKLVYSKTYMFYSLKMMYYKFGWLIKLVKKYIVR